MKEEKVFDNRVKALVSEAALSGDWPKEELWRAIEKRQEKKNRAWYYYAAIVLLFLSFSGYLINLGKSQTVEVAQILKEESSATLVSPEVEESKQLEFLGSGVISEKNILSSKPQLTAIVPQMENMELAASNVITEEKIPIHSQRKIWNVEPMNPIKTSGLRLSETSFEIALLQENEPQVAKSIYLYIPEKGEKERYSKVGRLFKQIGRFNTEGEFDWEEVNVKPQLIWAYLKESTKSQ